MHDDDELTPAERDAFRQLPKTMAPSTGFEDRVVDRLRADGAIAAARTRGQWRWQIAAAIVLLAGGVAIGRVLPHVELPPSASSAGTTEYLLLLYGAGTSTPDAERARVIEYGNWAREEFSAGRMIRGDRLGEKAYLAGNEFNAPPTGRGPSGFFLIRAKSFGEAIEIAGRCPHVRHGGTVVVQQIE